jgi:hypothetical protein
MKTVLFSSVGTGPGTPYERAVDGAALCLSLNHPNGGALHAGWWRHLCMAARPPCALYVGSAAAAYAPRIPLARPVVSVGLLEAACMSCCCCLLLPAVVGTYHFDVKPFEALNEDDHQLQVGSTQPDGLHGQSQQSHNRHQLRMLQLSVGDQGTT